MVIRYQDINMTNACVPSTNKSTSTVLNLLHEKTSLKWSTEIHVKPKLRTYLKFKETYEVEQYVIFLYRRKSDRIYYSSIVVFYYLLVM